jgi:hypothetical protein
MNESEALAKLVIEKLEQGSEAAFCEDQSVSRSDFMLHLPGGDSFPMEVTVSTEPDIRAAIHALEKHGFFIKTETLERYWLIVMESTARVKLIREKAEKYIQPIEMLGIVNFHFYMNANEFDEVRRIYEDLGIEGGRSISGNETGILLIPPFTGGKITAKYLINAIESECNKEDNRRKLFPCGHIVVIIDTLKYQAWCVLERAEGTPDAEPSLPSEVRKLWVIATMQNPSHHIVWAYEKDVGWIDKGTVSVRKREIDLLINNSNARYTDSVANRLFLPRRD